MYYNFGEKEHFKCFAKTYENAVEMFALEVLFPEEYISDIPSDTYDSDLNRYVFEPKADMKIPVYTSETGENYTWEKFADLPLFDVLDFDYTKYRSDRVPLIEQDNEENSSDTEITPYKAVETFSTKKEARNFQKELWNKKKELELKWRELEEAMSVFKQKMEMQQKQFYACKTYLQSDANIVQIKKGKSAPSEERLAIYQQKLYMDEEVSLTLADGDDFYDGMDIHQIEEFDRWISEHYKDFLPREKSLMAWQVRRKEKDYRTDHFSNTILNLGNTNTYFLIRNGENLYRLISEYHIGEKLFPEKDFFMPKEGESSWDIDNKEERREQYAFIAIQLQGLLDFSNILDAKIDLLRETENMDYIRNAEPNAISDGHVSWNEYVNKNIASISQGTRIVVKANAKLSSWSYSRNNDNRTAFPSNARPSKNKIYIIEETRTPNGYSIGEFKILVESGDDIYDRYYESHKRKNRVGYWLWNDEVLNIDTITFEDIDYFIRTRFYRSQYNDIIPTMKYVWKILKEEKKQEEPFIKLLMSQTGKEQTECEETLREWKTKNKWKRGVEAKTESLAFRMCRRKLLQGRWN